MGDRVIQSWTRTHILHRGSRDCIECMERITWGRYQREVVGTPGRLAPQFRHYEPVCA